MIVVLSINNDEDGRPVPQSWALVCGEIADGPVVADSVRDFMWVNPESQLQWKLHVVEREAGLNQRFPDEFLFGRAGVEPKAPVALASQRLIDVPVVVKLPHQAHLDAFSKSGSLDFIDAVREESSQEPGGVAGLLEHLILLFSRHQHVACFLMTCDERKFLNGYVIIYR